VHLAGKGRLVEDGLLNDLARGGDMARKLRSSREWAGIVEKWRLSGLGVKEFCSREGVGESRFYDARKETETGISRYNKRKIEQRDVEVSKPLFLPVKVQASHSAPSDAAGNNHPASHLMELTLSNGYSLRFPSTLNTQTLIKIANALTSKTC
jgi:hypothetical protein